MVRRNWLIASSVLLLLLLLSSLSITHVGEAVAATPIIPAGILYYVPITLTNSQSSSTPIPFQQIIQVDSASYSAYEASNLQNVEFFDSNGSIIASWLESGNTNTANNTVYWLRLDNGIPAQSSTTIYMGFASTSTSLRNGQTTGEAPDLSAPVGAYDDGANVFLAYGDFDLGLGSWTPYSSSGNFVPTFTSNGAEMLDNGGGENNFLFLKSNVPEIPIIIEYSWEYEGSADASTVSVFGVSPVTSAPGVAMKDSVYAEFWYYRSTSYLGKTITGNNIVAQGSFPGGGNFHIVSQLTISSSSTASAGYVQSDLSLENFFQTPVPALLSGSIPNPFSNPTLMIDGFDGGSASYQYLHWIVARAYPPNGIMPSVSLGPLSGTTTTSLNCSPSPVALGSSTVCTATVAGQSPTGTITWSANVTGSFSANSCVLSSGSCQIAYTPAQVTSPVTITANYGGDTNNKPATGTFSLTVSKAVSSATVNCYPSPVSSGSSATCTVTVSGHSPGGILTWASSGVANFSPAPTCTLSAQTCSVMYTPSSPISPVTITVVYSGDQDNLASSGTFSLSVAPLRGTNTTVSCTPTPVTVGTPAACTAEVTGNSPTGTVTLSSNSGGTFMSSACSLASGHCTVSYTPSSVLTVTITAVYSGDSNNQGSAGTFSLPVTKASSSVSVKCTPSTVTLGSSSSCLATVSGYSPSGFVTFTSSSSTGTFTPSDQCTLSSGICEVSYYDTTQGTPQITVAYVGDSNNGGGSGTFSLAFTSTATSSSTTSIPEFPVQFGFALLVTVVIVASYVVVRRITEPRRGS